MGITKCENHDLCHRQQCRRQKYPLMLNLRKNLPIISSCYVFLLVFLTVSSSSSAADCTPKFSAEDLGDANAVGRDVVIKEGSSFRLKCHLKHFQPIKWTLNKWEINATMQSHLNIREKTHPSHKGNVIFTEIIVTNATKNHTGEYKCTPQCLDGSNDGLRVIVVFGEKPQIDCRGAECEHVQSSQGDGYLVRYSAIEKKIEIKCTAKNVKLIKWVKGNSKTDGSDIHLCSEKRKHPNQGENETEFQKHKDNPCTKHYEEKIVTDGNNVKSVEKVLVLYFPWTRAEDFGPYTCVTLPQDSPSDTTLFGLDGSATVHLRQKVVRLKRASSDEYGDSSTNQQKNNKTFSVRRFFPKGHRSITVIEGNRLHIFCDVTPPVNLKMRWSKDDEPLNVDSEKFQSDDKIEFYNTTSFAYKEAEAKHRGWYKCEATHNGKTEEFKYYVRVKDKLMPLWPFLGICGEVAILCLIIIIYEKRRNKAELEESDTDGSPDQ